MTTSRETANQDVVDSAAAEVDLPSERMIEWIFLLLGVGSLLPWNAFVSAEPYFEARLCSNDGVERTTSNPEVWFALAFNLASVLSLGLLLVGQSFYESWKQRVSRENRQEESQAHDADGSSDNNINDKEHGKSSHSFWMVMVPLGLYLAVFLFTDLLVIVPNISPSVFLFLTLLCLVLCGMSGAIAGAGIVGTAGLFPANVGINPYITGQAVGGVAVSVANFLSAIMEDPGLFWEAHCHADKNDDDGSATMMRGLEQDDDETCVPYRGFDYAVFIYFGLGVVALAFCIVGYTYIDKYQRAQESSRYEAVQSQLSNDQQQDTSPRIGLELTEEVNSAPGLDIRRSQSMDATTSEDTADHRTLYLQPTMEPTVEHYALPTSSPPESPREDDNLNATRAVWTAVKGPAIAIFLVFAVTLAMFPSSTSELQSIYRCQNRFRLFNDLYTPFTFVVFNMGDLMGRLYSARTPFYKLKNASSKLVFASLLRLIFFPLLMFCVAANDTTSYYQIRSDLYSLFVQFAMAFTNGWIASCAFAYAPTLLPATAVMQDRSSEILSLALLLGLLCGSTLAIPFSQMA